MRPAFQNSLSRKFSRIAILTVFMAFSHSAGAENLCRSCHLESGGDLAAPAEAMERNDVHASRGLSCEACHGGDPTAPDAETAMSPQKGFIGTPSPRQIPDLCARCHASPEFMRRYSVTLPTDQYEKYWTSRHGLALRGGDTKVATCVDCHGAHGILPANNPKSSVWRSNIPKTCQRCHGDATLMSQYNLPANTVDEYSQGVHGKALLEKNDAGAPACNNCHGNHGAVPPGFASIAQVCRDCHPANSEMFLASPHKEAFDAMGLKECVACHSNHFILPPDDSWLGVQGAHSCSQCHSSGDKGFSVAVAIKTLVDSLRLQEDQARFLVHEAERRGIEISQAQDILKQAHDMLLQLRTVTHTVDVERISFVVDSGLGLASQAAELGRQGRKDFRFRSLGLGIASILITLLIVALWLKLRDIEKHQRKTAK